MASTRHRRITAALVAVGVAVTIAVAGCGADDSGAGDTAGSGFAGEQADGEAGAEPGAAPGAAQDSERGAAQPPGGTDVLVDPRAIIYTGALSLRLKNARDLDETAAKAVSIVTVAGGFVGGDRRTSDDGNSQATLELRVPADKFTAVVNELAGLADEESRSINTEDVTEAVVDLDARIATQQASVNRTRALLARAETIGEIVSVETELTKREAELASLQAKKRRLADLTSLSTITLTLLGPEAAVAQDEPDRGFLSGLKAGWKAFLASMEVLLTILGALLPWVLALGLPIVGLVWLLRRLGRRAAPTPPLEPVSHQPNRPAGPDNLPPAPPAPPTS